MRTLFRECLYLIEPGTRGRWLALAALAVLSSLVEALSALLVLSLLTYVAGDGTISLPLIGDLQDRFPQANADSLLAILASIVGAAFVLRGGLYLFQSYMQNRIAFRAAARLSARLLRGYFAQPWPVFLTRHTAEMTRNAHESPLNLAMQVLVPGVSIASEAALLVAIVAVLAANAPELTVAAAALLGSLVVILLHVLAPRLSRYGRLGQELGVASYRKLGDALHGMRDIRLLRREHFFRDRFLDDRYRIAEVNYKRAALSDIPRIALETTVILSLAGYLGIATTADVSDTETIRTLGLFAYGVMRALPSVNRIMSSVTALRFGRALIEDLYKDTVNADMATRGQVSEESSSRVRLATSIDLDRVAFRYAAAEANALDGISFSIARGEAVGLVGPTGGGKSTLVDVITGLIEPTSGDVLIDGKPLDSDVAAWQRSIGVVPQQPFLIDDTLRRNIALGAADESIDEEALLEAIGVAQLESVVRRLPNGLDTMLGDRGSSLSGGERQRVSIARALYRRPDVLVLDEGTSALDNVTEASFIRALEQLRGKLTILVVAHRLTTVRGCDRLLLVVDGKIADEGPFDELAIRSPLFREMVSGS